MQSSLRGWRGLCAAVVASVVAGTGSVAAQDLASFEKRLTVHTLANGWTFLIFERPGAPVFSFATHVDVGSAQEVPGITGLAHMFEHMAFKGTPRHRHDATTPAEKAALDGMEAAYRPTSRPSASPRPRRQEARTLCRRLQGPPGRGGAASSSRTSSTRSVPRGRRRAERRAPAPTQTHVLLLAAGQQARAVRLPRVRALPPPGVPRVLQGARRRHGGAAAAHREPADRPAGRAVPRHGLRRAPLPAAGRSAT